MLGATKVIFNAGFGIIYIVTQDTDTVLGDDYYGHDSGFLSGTSIAPASIGGAAIEACEFIEDPPSGDDTFWVRISGNRAKSFFTSLIPEGYTLLNTDDATHSYNGGDDETSWLWDLGAQSQRPSVWDGSGTVGVRFFT